MHQINKLFAAPPGTDIHLEEEQLEEYHRLKQEAAQRCAPYQQTLGQLSRQHKIQLDSLANEERRISELRAVLSRKEEEVKEAMHREDCLKEKLRSFTKAKVDKDMMLKVSCFIVFVYHPSPFLGVG